MSARSVPFPAARTALAKDLAATFESGYCESAWPEAYGAAVTVGTPGRDQAQACAWVEEQPDAMSAEPHATGRTATFRWTLTACLWSKRPTRELALATVDQMAQAAVAAVLCDPTLCRSVERAVPYVGELMVAQSDDRKWCAAATVSVDCQAGDVCAPPDLAREIEERRAQEP